MGPKPRTTNTGRGNSNSNSNYVTGSHNNTTTGGTGNDSSSVHSHTNGHGHSSTSTRGKSKHRAGGHGHGAGAASASTASVHGIDDTFTSSSMNGASNITNDMASNYGATHGATTNANVANNNNNSNNVGNMNNVNGKHDPKSHTNARLDFSTLPAPTLRRYQRVHKLHHGKIRGGHREDLASAVARHFNNQMVNEVESIAWFIYAVRSRDNELKMTQKPPS
ncbi:hypothetical protein BDF22DRAFT_688362 [Syncephalis plumigaleata]|nr:hypothetical protein BDF22DRAFT_688362 [Syncephalis plumigaleata]